MFLALLAFFYCLIFQYNRYQRNYLYGLSVAVVARRIEAAFRPT